MKTKIEQFAKFLVRLTLFPFIMITWPMLFLVAILDWATNQNEAFFNLKKIAKFPYQFLIGRDIF